MCVIYNEKTKTGGCNISLSKTIELQLAFETVKSCTWYQQQLLSDQVILISLLQVILNEIDRNQKRMTYFLFERICIGHKLFADSYICCIWNVLMLWHNFFYQSEQSVILKRAITVQLMYNPETISCHLLVQSKEI